MLREFGVGLVFVTALTYGGVLSTGFINSTFAEEKKEIEIDRHVPNQGENKETKEQCEEAKEKDKKDKKDKHHGGKEGEEGKGVENNQGEMTIK